MHQTWTSFATIINKCLSGKTTALESLRLSRSQILWEMYHNKTIDYVYLLWEDLVYQVENKNSKKKNDMYYPRFTKVIVYGAILPQHMTNQAMLESEAYMTYHSYATGEKTPKPKSTKKKVDSESSPKMKLTQASKGKRIKTVALNKAKQIKLATKRSLIQTYSSHTSGSAADEGTGNILGVPDLPTYMSKDNDDVRMACHSMVGFPFTQKKEDNDDDADNDDDVDKDDEDDDADNQDDEILDDTNQD
ncbi:hypothetical protein Tco_0846606, partial [Tanacetum coccineum]